MPHCIDRARERYGLELCWDDIRALEAMIAPENCFRTTPEGRVHVLLFQGVGLIAGVRIDKGRAIITTFLPSDYFTRGRHKQAATVVLGKAGKYTGNARRMHLQRRHKRRALLAAE